MAHVAVRRGGIGAARDVAQVVGGNVAGELRENLEREIRIRQAAPAREFFLADLRVFSRQIETAVACEAAQQRPRRAWIRNSLPYALPMP
jgi:hypothetical protein